MFWSCSTYQMCPDNLHCTVMSIDTSSFATGLVHDTPVGVCRHTLQCKHKQGTADRMHMKQLMLVNAGISTQLSSPAMQLPVQHMQDVLLSQMP